MNYVGNEVDSHEFNQIMLYFILTYFQIENVAEYIIQFDLDVKHYNNQSEKAFQKT